MRAQYRLRQGFANMTAVMRQSDWELVEDHLNHRELALFRAMHPADQRHSVAVLRALIASGNRDPHLLKAGLLHDVGKSRCRITIVHRTLAVLSRVLFGRRGLVTAWPVGQGWWTPFYVMANHSRIGASMLAKVGSDERVWRLAELHEVPSHDLSDIPDLEWVKWALNELRRADEQN